MDKNKAKKYKEKDKEKDENAEYRKEYNAAVTQRMKDEKIRQKALASQRLQVMYQEKSALLQEMQRLKAQLRKTERDNNIIRRQSVEQATIIAKKSSLAKSVMDEMLRLNIEAKTRACLWCLRCQWQKKVFAAFCRWWCNVVEARTVTKLKGVLEDKWRSRIVKAKMDQKNSSIAEKASWKAAQSAKRMVERLMIHSRSKKHVVRSNVRGDKAFLGSPTSDQEDRRINLLNEAQRFLGMGRSNMNSPSADVLQGGGSIGSNIRPRTNSFSNSSQSQLASAQDSFQNRGITLGDQAITSTDYFNQMESKQKKRDHNYSNVQGTDMDDVNDVNDDEVLNADKTNKFMLDSSPSMSDALMSLALEELGDIGQLNQDDKNALKDILEFSPIASLKRLNANDVLPQETDNDNDLNIGLNASKHYLNDTVDGNSYSLDTSYRTTSNNKDDNGNRIKLGLDTKTPTTVTKLPSYMQHTVSTSLSEAKKYNDKVVSLLYNDNDQFRVTTTRDNNGTNSSKSSPNQTEIKKNTGTTSNIDDNDDVYLNNNNNNNDAVQNESMSMTTSKTSSDTANDDVDNKYKIPKFASGKMSKSTTPTSTKTRKTHHNSGQQPKMYRAQRELIDGSHHSYIVENSSTIKSTTFKIRHQAARHQTAFR